MTEYDRLKALFVKLTNTQTIPPESGFQECVDQTEGKSDAELADLCRNRLVTDYIDGLTRTDENGLTFPMFIKYRKSAA